MRISKAVGLAVSVGLLSGCATFDKAHHMEMQAEHNATRYQIPKEPPVVETVNTPYLMGAEVRVVHPVSALLQRKVTIVSATPMTLPQIAAKITELTGIPVHTENLSNSNMSPGTFLPPLPNSGGPRIPGAGGSQPSYATQSIPLDWHGSISGLLNMVTAKDGVWWKYSDGAVQIFRTETRTFSIPALAWSTSSSGSNVDSNSVWLF